MKPAPIPRLWLLGLFVFYLLFLWLAFPANHIESIDRHIYATWAESQPLDRLVDTRSILFTTLNRGLYLAGQALAPGIPVTALLEAYSMLAGAGAVVLTALMLARHFRLAPTPAVAGGLLLGLSYGFWRYAVEVEVYVASIFLVLVAAYFLIGRLEEVPKRPIRFILPGLASGLVVMFYQPNVFPLFLAAPVLFLARDRILPFLVYGSAGVATVLATFAAAFLISRDGPLTPAALAAFAGSRNTEFHVVAFDLTEFAKMIFAIGHTWLSSNWVFGIDALTGWFTRSFPATETGQRVLAAAHFRPWLYLPLALAPVVLVLGGQLLWFAARPGPWRIVAWLLAWIALYAFVAGRLDPGTSEVWITMLPPVALLFAAACFGSAFATGRAWQAGLLLVCLLLWNWSGGIGMLKNPDGDYLGRQVAVLKPLMREGDLLILSDGTWKSRTTFSRLLPGRVLALDLPCEPGPGDTLATLDQALAATQAAGGRVYLPLSFTDPPARFERDGGCPARRDNALALARHIRDRLALAGGEGEFMFFEIGPPQ